MNIISCGAQYRVINMENGRVKKSPITHQESEAIVAGWTGTPKAPVEGRKINYRHAAMRSSSYVQKLIMLRPEIAYTFGNPQFEGLGVYTQDHLQTFGEALQRGKYDPQKLINGYVDLILLHWQYGIAERTFNCTVNNGVDTLGRVMLLDFGEITTSQQKAAAQIKTQRWQRAWSFNSGDIPTKLQEYYHRVLQTRLSLEALKVAWRVKR